jgi:hypothetical protein
MKANIYKNLRQFENFEKQKRNKILDNTLGLMRLEGKKEGIRTGRLTNDNLILDKSKLDQAVNLLDRKINELVTSFYKMEQHVLDEDEEFSKNEIDFFLKAEYDNRITGVILIYNLLARSVLKLPFSEKKVLRDNFLQFIKNKTELIKLFKGQITKDVKIDGEDYPIKDILEPYINDALNVMKFIVQQFDDGTFFRLNASGNKLLEDTRENRRLLDEALVQGSGGGPPSVTPSQPPSSLSSHSTQSSDSSSYSQPHLPPNYYGLDMNRQESVEDNNNPLGPWTYHNDDGSNFAGQTQIDPETTKIISLPDVEMVHDPHLDPLFMNQQQYQPDIEQPVFGQPVIGQPVIGEQNKYYSPEPVAVFTPPSSVVPTYDEALKPKKKNPEPTYDEALKPKKPRFNPIQMAKQKALKRKIESLNENEGLFRALKDVQDIKDNLKKGSGKKKKK